MLPEVNDSPFRRTLYEYEGWRDIQRALSEHGITPGTHPHAGDFFAGDCGGAYALEQSGWPVENIVCFDFCRSPSPVVVGVEWIYGDLRDVLNSDPNELRATMWGKWHQHFQIVIAVNGWWPKKSLIAVAHYFLAPGGYVYT